MPSVVAPAQLMYRSVSNQAIFTFACDRFRQTTGTDLRSPSQAPAACFTSNSVRLCSNHPTGRVLLHSNLAVVRFGGWSSNQN